jgi:hypothetical protein
MVLVRQRFSFRLMAIANEAVEFGKEIRCTYLG